jgi:hypothetical protein
MSKDSAYYLNMLIYLGILGLCSIRNIQVFLESIFERGIIEATLIIQDRILIDKVNSHQLLQ